MATSANALIQVEQNQVHHAAAAMTDAGDHQNFTISGGTLWSGKSGFTPVVRPNGVVSGRSLVTTHASNDTLTIAGCTCYLAGVLTTIAGAVDQTITRPVSAVAKINSVIITAAGVYDVLAGVDGLSAAFSTTRGAAGGPPYIPVGAIEVAQIKVVDDTPAVIASTEIFQNGNYTERFDFPTWAENNVGLGETSEVAAQKNAFVRFDTVLAQPHTGDLTKGVYIEYYAPEFSDLAKTSDFVPVENSSSVSSVQTYGNKTIGSSAISIGSGGFKILLNDGITDGILALKDQVVTIKYFSDQDKSAYSLTQGTLSMKRTYPVAGQNAADVTIAAENITADFSS